MPQFFQNLYTTLNTDNNHTVFMVVFLIILAIALTLRIVAHLHYKTALLLFQMDAKKKVAEKADFAKLKNLMLKKALIEYNRTAEKAVSVVSTGKIAERAVASMSLFGWKYEAIVPLVKSLDIGLLLVGAVLALSFPTQSFLYGTLAVIAFLLTRIVAAFFNADGAKQQLVDELTLYMEREAGRFFATDVGGTILRLKDGLAAAMEKQSAEYKEATSGVSSAISATLTTVSANMLESTKLIAPAIKEVLDEKLINMNDTLNTALKNWEKALAEAARLHVSMNSSSEKLSGAVASLNTASGNLTTGLTEHGKKETERLNTLITAVNKFTAAGEALTTQAKYIERNQHVLSESLHSYEETLQQVTASIGEGLGAFINMHAQMSAQAVSDALKSNMEKVLNAHE